MTQSLYLHHKLYFMNNVVPVNNIRSFQECRLPLVLCYDILKRCSKTKCCKQYRQSSQFAVPNFLQLYIYMVEHWGKRICWENVACRDGLCLVIIRVTPPFGTQLSGFLYGTQCAKDQYAVRKNSFISYADINFYFKKVPFLSRNTTNRTFKVK